MSGLIESAASILGVSERRLEVTAQNVANVSTPGYKRQISFLKLIASTDTSSPDMQLAISRNFAQGSLTQTNNPFDLAISGTGFFQLRTPEGLVYSRQGQFHLSADGTAVTPQGYVLQQAGGGDLVLDHASVSILQDGTVLDQGTAVGRIGVFTPSDANALQPIGASYFTAPEGAMLGSGGGIVRQGMVENSNVSVGDEMVAMTAAVRQSETGARLIQVYDDLLGRAISNFGQGGR